MIKKNIKIILIVFFLLVLVFSAESYAGTQELNSLDFDVTLNIDGSMNVTETWNVYANGTNTLFKTFDYNSKLFENVSVYDVTDSKQYNDVGRLQYHVNPGGFYGLKNKEGDFEIAWNIGADSSSKTKVYKISYTVKDVIRVYNDCAEFYWQFISDSSGIPAKNITGTIKLPSKVSNIEELRVWAHGPLIGEINKGSEDTVIFTLPKLSTNTMLEVRVTTPPGIFETAANRSGKNKLDSIISEETVWANDANNQRTKAKKALEQEEKIKGLAVIVTIVVSTIGIFWKKGTLNDNPKIVPTTEYEYFREIPDENATPADAEYMINLGKKFNTGNVISATLLDLSLKGYIEFIPNPTNQKEVTMKINNKNTEMLKTDEQAIFRFIDRASGIDKSITNKEFKKYASNNNERAYDLWKSIDDFAKRRNTGNENVDNSVKKKGAKYGLLALLWFVIIGAGFMFAPVLKFSWIVSILGVINLLECIMLVDRFNGFTQKAIDEQQHWKGLKKFMENFSLLNERNIPELELWDKYLVYATAFGISEKVLKQLKMKFPELQDDEYFRTRHSSMYYCTNNDFGRSFGRAIQNAYAAHASEIAASTMSSGSGGGGGFSSGGGRRLRRRKHGRKIKMYKKYRV